MHNNLWSKHAPGAVRDAIISYLKQHPQGASVKAISDQVNREMGYTPASSIRSYLGLNIGTLFERKMRGLYQLKKQGLVPRLNAGARIHARSFVYNKSKLFLSDCMDWLDFQLENSVHAVVTDPPYGLLEYTNEEQTKLRNGKGGIWRIPPSFDGNQRAPLPRFTILTEADKDALAAFFFTWASRLIPVLVPGANVLVASNPLLSYVVSNALARAGLERRGEVIRLVTTMRGGDRPKDAHVEFAQISVMPRSMWEPWLVFRKPLEGRVQDNLRRWGTGGFRRPSESMPFGDVIRSSPTQKKERALAPHPSLKPQSFLRQIVRAALPLGQGVVLDPFAGAGSTLAAAEAVGYASVGIEKDPIYFETAKLGIPKLAALRC